MLRQHPPLRLLHSPSTQNRLCQGQPSAPSCRAVVRDSPSYFHSLSVIGSGLRQPPPLRSLNDKMLRQHPPLRLVNIPPTQNRLCQGQPSAPSCRVVVRDPPSYFHSLSVIGSGLRQHPPLRSLNDKMLRQHPPLRLLHSPSTQNRCCHRQPSAPSCRAVVCDSPAYFHPSSVIGSELRQHPPPRSPNDNMLRQHPALRSLNIPPTQMLRQHPPLRPLSSPPTQVLLC